VNVVRVCELFAGVGGFRFGLEKTSARFKTVFANEIDKWAASIYRYHWPDGSLREGDIRNIQAKDLPDFDLLCGGFPCQPFSMAGKHAGLRDSRGTLFQEILRIAKEKQPPMLFLENVPGLLSTHNGTAFQSIIEKMGELGYICEWKVFNSQFFGVPQSRRRVFIVAHTANQNRWGGTVFPIPQSNDHNCKKTSMGREIISPTPTTSSGAKCNIGDHILVTQSVVPTITSHIGSCGGSEPVVIVPRPTAKEGDQLRIYADSVPTLLARMGTGGGNVPFVLREDTPWRMRRLTCVECERLQSFPDHWTQYGLTVAGKQIEISNTQRYKTIGNAVTVNVITAVGKLIMDFFLKGGATSHD
jgi:DNA (cytosine-5)-methyltransferase 1